MERENLENRIVELENQIETLPAGSISFKTVSGREYAYHRWYEGKKRKEKYVSADEVDSLREKIDLRKKLQKELKALKKIAPTASTTRMDYRINVRCGESLRRFASPVRDYRKRECFDRVKDYVFGNSFDRVFILYGLRRTGKTTMIRQLLNEMSDVELEKSVFMQISPGDSLADVNHDLKLMEQTGIRIVFIDEVTLLKDFIEGAALFSDIFAACGMKIVLSGTDSLGFIFSKDNALYDRCFLLHTTFIPYREFEHVLGIRGIDEYIRYGGTMSMGGVHYNESSTFSSRESTDEYVNSAIARNIQHSLQYYQDEGHFRNLRELFEKRELTSVINRVVEDMNHRFTIEVLTREFQSNDLAISARNLRSDRTAPTDVLDQIDTPMVTEHLKKLLDILNKKEQNVTIEASHRDEIREYLNLLDLTMDIDIISQAAPQRIQKRTVITQPGLRYAQAEALIKSLLLDTEFASLSLFERNRITRRIESEIMGRMMEDIVLLETKLAFPKKQIFKLQFAVGEFDMVIFDPAEASCEIYEIKHSTELIPAQYKNLIDEKKCSDTEFLYGPIKSKCVLYRGEDAEAEGIRYQNVERYLNSLPRP